MCIYVHTYIYTIYVLYMYIYVISICMYNLLKASGIDVFIISKVENLLPFRSLYLSHF